MLSPLSKVSTPAPPANISKPEQARAEVESVIQDVMKLDGSSQDQDPRPGFVSFRNANLGADFGTTPDRARVAQDATGTLEFDPISKQAHQFTLSDGQTPNAKEDKFDGWNLTEKKPTFGFLGLGETKQTYSVDHKEGATIHSRTAVFGSKSGLMNFEETGILLESNLASYNDTAKGNSRDAA